MNLSNPTLHVYLTSPASSLPPQRSTLLWAYSDTAPPLLTAESPGSMSLSQEAPARTMSRESDYTKSKKYQFE